MKSYYYGISLDGLLLKVAEISIKKKRISLLRLESFKLTKSLFSEFVDTSSVVLEMESNSEIYNYSLNTEEIDPEDIDIFSDSQISENNLNDFSFNNQFQQSVAKKSIIENNPTTSEKSEFRTNAIYQFLSRFNLNKGKISLSCNESRIQWKIIKSKKKLRLSALKKIVLSNEQLHDKNINSDYITDVNNSYNMVIHTGDFELISLLRDSVKIVYNSKKELYYNFIEPYEISMLNIFNMFYPNPKSAYTTFLFLGQETKIGIVIKDTKFVKAFHIMIHDTDPQKVRETVYAKLLFEHESSDCPIIENIVFAGNYASEEDIVYYNSKTQFQHELFKMTTLKLNKQKFYLDVAPTIPIETIPAFVVSLSLGLKSAFAKRKDSCKFNLLPNNIIEARKVFEVGWLSILLVMILSVVTVYGTFLSLDSKATLAQQQTANTRIRAELNFIRNFESVINSHQHRIEQLQLQNTRSSTISIEKNTWSNVIQTLSDFTNRNPLIWIESISSQETRFSIRGKSYHRDRITNLSNLFNNGHITRIVETSIAGHTVWDYDISFLRPKSNELAALNFPAHLQTFDMYKDHVETLRRSRTLSNANVVAVTEQRSVPVNDTASEAISLQEETANLYNLARNNYLSNNFIEAIFLLESYISKYPSGSEISLSNYLLGELYFVVNSFDRAIPYFHEVLRLQKEQIPEALFFVSKSYEALGNYENALRYYTQLIERYPRNPLSATAREQISILKEGS